MLLAALASESGGSEGVKWQQGTFDPERYGEMYVNGKLVRSGPSSSGDSFWDQSATPPAERSIIIRDDKSRNIPAPPAKSVQDAIVRQYVKAPEEKSVIEEIASVVKSLAPEPSKPRTEYVTAQPSYYSLDSIFKSFGLDSQPKQQSAPPAQQKKPTTQRASSPVQIPQLATRAANLFSPLEFPRAQPARATIIRRQDPMIPVLVMIGVGAALLGGGILLMNRKV